MQTRFFVPMIVATAFHTLVFFGFDSSDVSAVVEPPVVDTKLPPIPPDQVEVTIDDEPAIKDSSAELRSQRKGEPDVFRPQLDDPPLLPGDWVIKPEPIHPRPFAPTDRIGPSVLGDRDGDGDDWTNRPIVRGDFLDDPPRTRSQIAPIYPAQAKASGITGEVLVEFVVGEHGRVVAVRVVRSTDRIFEAATLRAVEQWRFEPGRRGGRPVRFQMVVPVVFGLDR